MSVATIDADLVIRICRDSVGGGTVIDVVSDPLDGSVWVRMSSGACARNALQVLNAHGIGGRDLEDRRLHVTGWDARLLRRRLGVLLAGVDDLKAEWDATAEIVCYHLDRRVAAGVEVEPWAVLADVETAMRGCTPIPHRAPHVEDVGRLLELIAAAEDAYQQLIAEHLDYAERVLADRLGRHGAA